MRAGEGEEKKRGFDRKKIHQLIILFELDTKTLIMRDFQTDIYLTRSSKCQIQLLYSFFSSNIRPQSSVEIKFRLAQML